MPPGPGRLPQYRREAAPDSSSVEVDDWGVAPVHRGPGTIKLNVQVSILRISMGQGVPVADARGALSPSDVGSQLGP